MTIPPVAQRFWAVLTWCWVLACVGTALACLIVAFDEEVGLTTYSDRIDLLLYPWIVFLGTVATQLPRAVSYILTGQFKLFPNYSPTAH